MPRRILATLAVAVLAAGTAVPAAAQQTTSQGTSTVTDAAPPATTPSSASAKSRKKGRVDARQLVRRLTVSREKHAGSYQRSRFRHWVDADRNGCDTRREVLIEESRKRIRPGKRCKVTKGRWVSYFDDARHRRASKLDIDHLVPLAEAWRSGASRWNDRTREAFANDLGYAPSLVAVTASVNRSKGDKDPASWLPRVNQCRYVSEWVGVKTRWGLTVDKPEKRAINRTLRGCSKSERMIPKPTKAKIGKDTSKPKPPKKPKDPKPDVVVKTFANCTDLRGTYPNGVARSKSAAAGLRYAPFVHAKLYEANSKMDRDKDGVACERG